MSAHGAASLFKHSLSCAVFYELARLFHQTIFYQATNLDARYSIVGQREATCGIIHSKLLRQTLESINDALLAMRIY